jgi:hypothetical protein
MLKLECIYSSLNWLVVAISDETNEWMILAINLKAFSLEMIYHQHK